MRDDFGNEIIEDKPVFDDFGNPIIDDTADSSEPAKEPGIIDKLGARVATATGKSVIPGDENYPGYLKAGARLLALEGSAGGAVGDVIGAAIKPIAKGISYLKDNASRLVSGVPALAPVVYGAKGIAALAKKIPDIPTATGSTIGETVTSPEFIEPLKTGVKEALGPAGTQAVKYGLDAINLIGLGAATKGIGKGSLEAIGKTVQKGSNKKLFSIVKPLQKFRQQDFDIQTIRDYGLDKGGADLPDMAKNTQEALHYYSNELNKALMTEKAVPVDPVSAFDKVYADAIAHPEIYGIEKAQVARSLRELKDYVDLMTKDGPLDLVEATKMKRVIGGYGKWLHGLPDKNAKTDSEIYNKFYLALKDDIEKSAGESGDKVKEINKHLQKLIPVEGALSQRASQISNNYRPGLMEWSSIIAGGEVGGVAGGLAAYMYNAANKSPAFTSAMYGVGSKLRGVPRSPNAVSKNWEKVAMPEKSRPEASAEMQRYLDENVRGITSPTGNIEPPADISGAAGGPRGVVLPPTKPVPPVEPSFDNPFWNLPKTKSEAGALGEVENVPTMTPEEAAVSQVSPEDLMTREQAQEKFNAEDMAAAGPEPVIENKALGQELRKFFGVSTKKDIQINVDKLPAEKRAMLERFAESVNTMHDTDLPQWHEKYGNFGYPDKSDLSIDDIESMMNSTYKTKKKGGWLGGESGAIGALGETPDIEPALKARGIRGDDLLDQKDKLDEIIAGKGEVDSHGYVILYHRTTKENADKIVKSGMMTSKEDGLFFGTRPTGQIEGYGDVVVKVKLPIEKLEVNDIFTDETHLRLPTNSIGKQTQVGKAEIWNPSKKNGWFGRESGAIGTKKIKGKDVLGRDIPDWRGEEVVHYTTPEYAADINKNGYRILSPGEQAGYYGQAVSFTNDTQYAKQFGGVETRGLIAKDANILNLNDPKDWAIWEPLIHGKHVGEFKDIAIKNGIDGVYDAGAGDLFMYNPSKVKVIKRKGAKGSSGANMLGGMAAGSATGATAGAQVGDTPEERKRNMLIGAGLGLVGGAALGAMIPASIVRQMAKSAESGALTLPGGVLAHTGDDIAKKLGKGVKFNGVQLDAQDKPVFMVFTDPVKTKSTFTANSLDEAYKKYQEMLDRFEKARQHPISALGKKFGNESGAIGTAPEPLYSNAQNALSKIKQDKAPASQWLAMLDPAKGLGTKADESEWIGLNDYLKGKGNSAVTKQELNDFIEGNKIQLEEAKKGGIDKSIIPILESKRKAIQDEIQSIAIPSEVEKISDELDNINVIISENFGSGLNKENIAKRTEIESRLQKEYSKLFEHKYEEMDRIDAEIQRAYNFEDDSKFASYQLPGGKNYREVLVTLPQKVDDLIIKDGNEYYIKGMRGLGVFRTKEGAIANIPKDGIRDTKATGAYKSSHWDEPNVLAHYRLNDRTIDGKKTLFVEEIQSDWHQAGRKKGYQGTMPPKYEVRKYEDGDGYMPYNTESQEFRRELFKTQEEAANRVEVLNSSEIGKRGVPNAPFSKTWHELGFKKILDEAVKNDYEKVAWTTGEQQAERYDLSKQLDKVTHWKNKDGTYGVYAYQKGTGPQIYGNQKATPDELESVIGKDLTKKIIETSPEQGVATLSGLDLKVGGEGMKGFYDDIIVKYANKYGKKWGVSVKDGYLNETASNPTWPIATAVAHGESPVHVIDITSEMKADILQHGQPMGSAAVPVAAATGGTALAALTAAGFASRKKKQGK